MSAIHCDICGKPGLPTPCSDPCAAAFAASLGIVDESGLAEPSPKDPRRGVPSDSALYRLSNCPGSHQMALLAGDNSGKWSKFGDEIHEALSKRDPAGLTLDQQETFDMCLAQADNILSEWLAGREPEYVFRDSMRLGLTTIGGVVEVTDSTTIELVNTGLADVIAIKVIDGQREFLILDYKTLRGDVPDAADSDQLRSLSVKVAKKWRCRVGRVAIVQPWVGPPTVADFNEDSLRAASEWLSMVLHDEFKASPEDRRAGDWCHWCPANAQCETFRNKALAPVMTITTNLPADKEMARAALFARAMELPADTLAGLMKGLRLVGWYQAAIEGAAKLRAKDDAEFQKWYRLKEGNKVREIVNPQEAFNLAATHGVTVEQFMSCTKVAVGGLEEAIRRASGPKLTASGRPHKTQFALSADAAELLVNSLEAGGAMTRKQQAEQLEEVEL